VQGWEAALEQEGRARRVLGAEWVQPHLPAASMDPSRAGGEPGAAYRLPQLFSWVHCQHLLQTI